MVCLPVPPLRRRGRRRRYIARMRDAWNLRLLCSGGAGVGVGDVAGAVRELDTDRIEHEPGHSTLEASSDEINDVAMKIR